MVVRGNPRGNPKQLAQYLLARGENERIRILEVDYQLEADAETLHQAIYTMGVTAEFTKTDKGLFHAQINPAPGADRHMTDERWQKAADILAERLKLQDQRRVIVLHTKKGRTHAHVVWERYDKTKGKMISDGFSRLGMDHARQEMERVFQQKATPKRNKHRPELKEALTRIWNNTKTGKEFLEAIREAGYWIGEGAGRHPFMVIDEYARSHDLPRQLKGARLKDVRERLRGEKLPTEKEAIKKAREAADSRNEREGKQREREQETSQQRASAFKETKDTVTDQQRHRQQQKNREKFGQFKDAQPDKTQSREQQRQQDFDKAAKGFAENREKTTDYPKPEPEKKTSAGKEKDKSETIDPRRLAFRKRMEELEKEQGKDKQLEYDW